MSCSLYQDVEAPDDAGDGHQVEGDAAAQLPPLQRTHVQLLPLSERFHLANIQTEFFSISWGDIRTELSGGEKTPPEQLFLDRNIFTHHLQ